MGTEVYLLCNLCNGITEGVGSGEWRDTIQCKKCGKAQTAKLIGMFDPIENKEVKRLYVVEDKFNIFL